MLALLAIVVSRDRGCELDYYRRGRTGPLQVYKRRTGQLEERAHLVTAIGGALAQGQKKEGAHVAITLRGTLGTTRKGELDYHRRGRVGHSVLIFSVQNVPIFSVQKR